MSNDGGGYSCEGCGAVRDGSLKPCEACGEPSAYGNCDNCGEALIHTDDEIVWPCPHCGWDPADDDEEWGDEDSA